MPTRDSATFTDQSTKDSSHPEMSLCQAPSSHKAEMPQDVRSGQHGDDLGVSPLPSVQIERASTMSHRQANVGGAAVSISVDPVALINTECITVTSAMRKHARWAHSSVSAILGGGSSGYRQGTSRSTSIEEKKLGYQKLSNGAPVVERSLGGDDDTLASRWGLRGKKGKSMQDNPLMSAFARLRSDLRGCTGKHGDFRCVS